jgi:hypothetical protein
MLRNDIQLQNRYNLNHAQVTGLQVANVTIAEGFTIQFPYFDIIATILDILCQHTEARIGKQVLHFTHVTTHYGGQTNQDNLLYKDIVSGMWWKDMEHYLRTTVHQPHDRDGPAKSYVLAIIPYFDGVSVDFFDSISMLPLVVTLGNLDREYRNFLSGKRLLAFIPNPSDVEIRVRTRAKREDVSHFRQIILNKYLEM